jgi:hypothetical protein
MLGGPVLIRFTRKDEFFRVGLVVIKNVIEVLVGIRDVALHEGIRSVVATNR